MGFSLCMNKMMLWRQEQEHTRFVSSSDFRNIFLCCLIMLFDQSFFCLSGNVQKQAEATVSRISFGEEEIVTPKKPATVPEVAKQRELSGTLQSQSDAKLNKQFSDSKFKELSGHNIFAPPPEIKLRPTVRALAYKDNFDLGQSDTKTVTLSQL